MSDCQQNNTVVRKQPVLRNKYYEYIVYIKLYIICKVGISFIHTNEPVFQKNLYITNIGTQHWINLPAPCSHILSLILFQFLNILSQYLIFIGVPKNQARLSF